MILALGYQDFGVAINSKILVYTKHIQKWYRASTKGGQMKPYVNSIPKIRMMRISNLLIFDRPTLENGTFIKSELLHSKLEDLCEELPGG